MENTEPPMLPRVPTIGQLRQWMIESAKLLPRSLVPSDDLVELDRELVSKAWHGDVEKPSTAELACLCAVAEESHSGASTLFVLLACMACSGLHDAVEVDVHKGEVRMIPEMQAEAMLNGFGAMIAKIEGSL